ncbi:MAG: ABC transporter ATP-binding protein/permease, partial [Sandaracinaceae bacterium]|nr:ABC transporter ATP-binding protein/permease [Sandaracinaceae bacterium]
MAEPGEDESDEAPERSSAAWRYAAEGLRLVWETSPRLTSLLVIATIFGGLAPAGAAYVARFVVDAVIDATRGVEGARAGAFWAIGLEGVLVTLFLASQRATAFAQSLLKARLAHHVNLKILRKAITLPLAAYEDPALQDRMEEARREATVRPLDLVMRVMTIARFAIGLAGFAALLVGLSWWTLVIVLFAGIPSFVSEARFSKEAFRFFQRHSPENRERHYLETLLTREDFAKEVGFYGLGPVLVGRYDGLFARLYGDDRRIATKRHAWGLALGLVGNLAFFLAYVWIVHKATGGRVTIGQMTMYLVVFRQAQQAVTSLLSALGGVYEDALYLENLDAFLAHPDASREGHRKSVGSPQDGLRVENVSFTYANAERPALEDVSFHLRPGRTLAVVGHNGSGKSTLVKLLTRRYTPTSGRILLDGLELADWTDEALRKRVSVLFQDFVRFKLTAGENIGAGDPARIDDEARWRGAAEEALAEEIVEA